MKNILNDHSYRYFVLVMLTLVYVFNFIDRQLLVILQESIKHELNLTDTQLGLLSGFTFALFYVTLGLPIARIADKGNRRNIVTISLGLWSIMTAVSGLVQNFYQLLLARIGVGIGEAGGSPPAHSMISDYFPAEKRATALSIYSTGIYFGILIGFLIGGYLNHELGWRVAFFALGIPGIVFSLLFYISVKEPKRGASDDLKTETESVSIITVVKYLFATKTFAYLGLATAFHVFCLYGVSNWAPSFLSRIHHMQSSEIGVTLGLLFGIGGALGTFLGGYLTDLYGKEDKSWYLRIPAIGALVSSGLAVGALFIEDRNVSLAFMGLCALMQSAYLGPSIAVSHSLVPANMRALTSAILFFILNILGLGLGPLTVGLLSDWLTPTYHSESIRWAMSIIIFIEIVASTFFFIAAKKLSIDLSEK
ncbi:MULTISPECIES: MFS transporter [Emticicia]|uniref:spinster family MFS transporter n=1 Tax=Emticicia TaxID=312278 RepID=UPI0007D89C14|nr:MULTISPECIES: MFS transporter [Emticicia]